MECTNHSLSILRFCFCLIAFLTIAVGVRARKVQDDDLRMPGVKPEQGDAYLCTAMELDTIGDHYLVGFTPHGSMETAHHMLLFGCGEPGSRQPAWNCGEMNGKEDNQYEFAPVCSSGEEGIIYAWAKNATELTLPKDVGFKVGGDTPIRYLVLQVHYMHPMKNADDSGLTLHSTEERMPRRAGTLLMVTGGKIGADSTENFETACEIDEPVVLHPFAFRTHTHKFGKVVSGWRVQRDDKGVDHWTLIGKQNPQLPQMFYPVKNKDLTVEQNDVVAARCHMKNDGTDNVSVGATGDDEMCNFYMMYWVDGDRILGDNTCFSDGPPRYYWSTNAGLNHIPEQEASNL